MGEKYSHGAWEQFADQASIILEKKSLNFCMAVQTLPGIRPPPISPKVTLGEGDY